MRSTEHVELDDGRLKNKAVCDLECITADGKVTKITTQGDRDIQMQDSAGRMMQFEISEGIILEGADERLLAVRKLVKDKRIDHVRLSECHITENNTSAIVMIDGRRIPIYQTSSGAYRLYAHALSPLPNDVSATNTKAITSKQRRIDKKCVVQSLTRS